MTNPPIEKLNLSDTQLITLLTRKPATPEAWQELRKSWTETLGKEPTDKDFALISQIFWDNETTQH